MSHEARGELRRHEQSFAVFRAFGYDMDAVRWEVRKIAEKIEEPVLDVGTGPGARMACVLASCGLHVTTIDASGVVLEAARAQARRRELLDRIEFIVMDAETMTFDDAAFAAAVGVNILHEVRHPARVVEEMARVTRPEGKIVVADLNPEGRELVDRVHRVLGHVVPAGPLDMRREVQKKLEKMNISWTRHRTAWLTVYVGTKKKPSRG